MNQFPPNSSTRNQRLIPFTVSLTLICCLLACDEAPSQIDVASEPSPIPVTPEKQVANDLNTNLGPGQDWPWFLGPDHNGTSDEKNIRTDWPEQGPPLVWEMTVGTGYSAPSVRGNRLVLHHRLENEEVVDCMHAGTSQPIWRYAYPSHFRDPYGYNNGPRCTPILTEEMCFTLGAEGKLLCLELATGKLIWQHDLRDEFDIPTGFFGIGATPLLEADKLIVAVGGQPNSGLVAFSVKTGEILWQNIGQKTWDNAQTGWVNEPVYHWEGDEMIVSYSSPQAATFHNQRHILCLMRQGLVSVNPENGEENFHHWFRSRTHDSVNAAQPVVVDDTILLGAAYRVGSERLRVAEDGQSVTTLWKEPRTLSTHWSTSIDYDGCYFGFSGRHENEALLQCVDAKTGEVRWETSGWNREEDLQQDALGNFTDRQTGEPIPWPFYGRGSAILVDKMLLVLGERGTLALVKANTDQWEEVARCAAPQMKYPSWTAPVLSRGMLYLRCEDALVCLQMLNAP